MEERTTRIIKISATGQVSTFGRLPALTQEQHHAPEIAVDSRGWVFAFRKESGCIFVFNSQGILTEEIKTPEQLVPVKLAMDWDNNLYWTTADGAIVGLDGSDDAHHHALDHITQRHDLYRSNYSKRVETAQSAQQEQKSSVSSMPGKELPVKEEEVTETGIILEPESEPKPNESATASEIDH